MSRSYKSVQQDIRSAGLSRLATKSYQPKGSEQTYEIEVEKQGVKWCAYVKGGQYRNWVEVAMPNGDKDFDSEQQAYSTAKAYIDLEDE